jgi:hypothetical protein
MKYTFEKVIDGTIEYIGEEMLSNMNDVQEFAARILISRVLNNQERIKDALVNNGFIRTFGIIDSEGNVDVEGLAHDIKREISRKEKITLSVPMFGKMTFHPGDVDALYKKITGGVEAHEED